MKQEDLISIDKALTAWWRSQRVEPNAAAYVMAGLAGRICSMYADDEKHLQEGICFLASELQRAAKAGFDQRTSDTRKRDLPDDIGLIIVQIGDCTNLSKRQAMTSATAWRGALQRYPNAIVDISLSGFNDDPRELWDIPEAVRFVKQWARYAGIDEQKAVSPRISDECVTLLTLCGVFGDELEQRARTSVIVNAQRP